MDTNQLLKAMSVGVAVSLIAISPALSQERIFGPGQPATIGDLPPGAFKSALESLPPTARGRALGILRRSTVPVEDLPYMRVGSRGDLFFEDPAFEADSTIDEIVPPAEITETNAFQLHSKPGAANILYLDFDGHDVTGTVWNQNAGVTVLNMRPYSTDTDYYNFSTTEIDRIAESWRRVAEDFAPFDIDVTTEEPASFGSNVGHILITQKQDADGDFIYNCNCGGVAYYNGFGNAYLSPGLVFNTSLTGVSEAISHEFGHNLNLNHDGTNGSSYYSGHGSGAVSWGPIMGASYNRSVTQWSQGEYSGANNFQDDLAIIASELSYRIDDHEDSILGLATPLLVTGGTNVVSLGRVSDPAAADLANKGIIEDRNDFDLFSMSVGTGTIDLTIEPSHYETYSGSTASNLDIEARLLDAFGTVLQTSNPDTDTGASINYVVTIPGDYYLEINGVGRGAALGDGYTDYGSIGEYYISGTVPENVIITDPPSAPSDLTATLVGDVNIELDWTDPATPAAADEDGYRIWRSVNGGGFALRATLPRDSQSFADNNLANGDYAYKVEVYNGAGTDQTAATETIAIEAPSVAVATSESTTSGSVLSGSYVNTQVVAGAETLAEQHNGGKPKNRRSFLNHTWTVTGVVPGATIDLEVRASAPTNSEDEDFLFSYSVNGGAWQSLGTIRNGTGTQTLTAALHPATNGTVQINVVDSDPGTAGANVTDTVTINEITITSAGDAGDQPPLVTIQSPGDGITVATGTEIFFEATAADEDGDLSSSLSWSSDLEGSLGLGANPVVALTIVGTHIVTASVADSASQTGADTVTINVSSEAQPTAMSISDLDGVSNPAGRGGKWQAVVAAAVADDLGNPVAGATVIGSWSAGASGSGSCVTNTSGSCSISKGGLKSNSSAATFTVTGITGALTYDAAGNSDPDGDSDGTNIVVTAPQSKSEPRGRLLSVSSVK